MTTSAATSQARTTRLPAIHTLAAAVDGLALSTVVLHAISILEVSTSGISTIMASAAATAMLVAPAVGPVIDRVGLPRSAAAASLLTAVALVGYATASSTPTMAVYVAIFMSAQAIGGAARQGMAVAGADRDARLRIRARMHTLLNAGIGFGTVAGIVLIAMGGSAVTAGYLVAAGISAAFVPILLQSSVAGAAVDRAQPGHLLLALRDRRFTRALGLGIVIALTMPILSVLLPAWIVQQTTAPGWSAAAALALNTAMVIAGQQAWTARIRSAADTARSAVIAAAGFGVAGAAWAGATHAPTYGALALIAVGAVALTVGEVAAGAALWRVALDKVPAYAEGRYQAAFSMTASAARVLGPLVALPLVASAPVAGWLALGVALTASALALARMAQQDGPQDQARTNDVGTAADREGVP